MAVKFNPARFFGAVLNLLALPFPGLAAWIAFRLFGMPRTRHSKPAEQEFLATGDLQFERFHGKRVAVYRWGHAGPLVLLAHGWESHSGRWRKLAPGLVEAGYRVIAVDAPAHGRSGGRHFTMLRYAELLAFIMEKHGPVDTLVGHSVGGAASIWALGALSPERRPAKAVILAAFSSLETVVNGARRSTGASPRLMRAFEQQILRYAGHPIEYFSLARTAERLEDIDSLILHDRADAVTPFRESERIHASWPGSRLIATTGFGHGLTAPEVWETLLGFITQENTESVPTS